MNGCKAANNYYQNRRNEALRKNCCFKGNGIKNAFLVGYLQGIKESLENQCTALMLIVPQRVEEKYKDMSSGFKKMQNSGLTVRGNDEGLKAKENGIRTGRNTIANRCIAATV